MDWGTKAVLVARREVEHLVRPCSHCPDSSKLSFEVHFQFAHAFAVEHRLVERLSLESAEMLNRWKRIAFTEESENEKFIHAPENHGFTRG